MRKPNRHNSIMHPSIWSIIFLMFFVSAAILFASKGWALSPSSDAAADPFASSLLFELTIGEKEPYEVGRWVDEESLTTYDRFYFPPSFCVGGEQIYVLDPIRRRLCCYTLSGKFVSSLVLDAEAQPLDLAYAPQSKKMLVALENSEALLKLDFSTLVGSASDLAAAPITRVSLVEALSDACAVQRVEFCGEPLVAIVKMTSGSFTSAAIEIDDKIGASKATLKRGFEESWIGEMYCADGLSAVALETKPPTLIRIRLSDGFMTRFPLSPEFASSDTVESSARVLKIAGTDLAGNTYLEVSFGATETTLDKAFVYKLDRSGHIAGRTSIPLSPEMLVNRYIRITPEGSIYYMRKMRESRSVGIYRFGIQEKN
jgi:hypothetical protein